MKQKRENWSTRVAIELEEAREWNLGFRPAAGSCLLKETGAGENGIVETESDDDVDISISAKLLKLKPNLWSIYLDSGAHKIGWIAF